MTSKGLRGKGLYAKGVIFGKCDRSSFIETVGTH